VGSAARQAVIRERDGIAGPDTAQSGAVRIADQVGPNTGPDLLIVPGSEQDRVLATVLFTDMVIRPERQASSATTGRVHCCPHTMTRYVETCHGRRVGGSIEGP
jgi:hypothetical protein